MTQDMIKTIRTIKMTNNGKSAQREPSLLCTSHEAQTVRLARTTTQARADHQSGWGGLWRSALLLLVMMMTVGVGDVWADDVPFTPTTNPSAPNYYLLQNVGTSSFYAMPYDAINDDGLGITTTNVPNSDMRFYFMSVENDDDYYYIIHCSGKYLYAKGAANDDGGARLKESSTLPTDDRYKFCIEKNGGGYYIKNKYIEGNTDSSKLPAPLCKRGGNTGIGPDGNNTKKNLLKWNTYRPIDDYFRWNFIPISDTNPITWTAPFTVSTEGNYHYYKIKNSVNTSFYISGNTSTNKVNTSSTAESDDITWIFKEVPAGENGSDKYITYYYIIHAFTGEYMCFNGVSSNYAQNQDDAIILQTKTAANEQKCQFIITRSSQRGATTLYNIIPKVLKDYYWDKQCVGQKDKTDETNVKTATDRDGDTNPARWIFEPATGYPAPCADPLISCDENGVVSMTCTESGAAIHYTIADGMTAPYDPTEAHALSTTFSNPITSTKTIKAIAIRGPHLSSVVTQTIVYVPNQTFDSETYDGTAKAPVVKVGDTTISVDEYDISYKKDGVTVGECKDAGTYTVTITDKTDGDYIVYGTGNFTIEKAPLSATVSLADWAYNETAAMPSVSGNVGNGKVTYAYKVKNAPDDTYTSYTSNPPSEVGTYTIKATIEETANYLEGVATTDFRITKIPFVFTVSMTGWTYGETASSPSISNNTSNGTVTYAYKVKDADDATYSPSRPSDAGNYTVKATIAETTNYAEVVSTTDFTIAKVALTATADNKSIVYGLAAPTYTITCTGFVNSETEEVLTTAPTATSEYTVGNNVGTYDIVPSGGEATNYSFTYVNGTLTVDPKTLTITAEAKEKTYGDADPALTYTSSGLVGSDAITGALSREEGEDAGTYAINQNTLTAGNNYDVSYTGANLTVNRREVGLDWGETNFTYNGSSQVPTATATNTVNSDAVDVEVSGAQTNAGSHTATASGLTGEKAGNYQLPEDKTQVFTISPKSIGDGTTPADGITVGIDESNNNIIVTGLTENDYSITESTDEDGNQVWTITGTGNYGGSVKVMRFSLVFYNTGVAANPGVVENVQDVAPFQAPTNMNTTGKDVYIVTGVNLTKQEVKLKKISYAPKGIPVLLLDDLTGTPDSETGAISSSFTASPINVAEGDEADTSKNILKQVTEEGGLKVGFAQVFMFYQGKFLLTTDGTMPKGKFYFDNPYPPGSQTAFGARLLKIVIDDTTGMEDAKSQAEEERSTRWYTLDGRSLSGKPTKKGLYLWNGRLVVIK